MGSEMCIRDRDDQVEYLRGKGVTAASISSCTEEEVTVIEKGKISVGDQCLVCI